MRLNYKRTIFVGFAFFLILAFWQAYDTVIPLILTNRFQMEQGYSGIIMSLDNILAMFMLPIFGALSDKVSTKLGKRTPFILVGTLLAAVSFILLGFASELWLFLLLLLVTLFSMAIFRSPAVALMPDVTPAPLRSKGNAVINLMGTAGGILILLFATLFKTSEPGKTDFSFYIVAVVAVMLFGLAMFLLFVKENKWAAEAEAVNQALKREKTEAAEASQPTGKLSKGELKSLLLILSSVALWYVGYNAITSKYSVYATEVLHVSYSTTLLVANAAAIVAYLPVGFIASKIGRKKTILIGVVMLFTAFLAAAFITENSPAFLMYVLFSLAGIGWATINVNSFPMAVELAKHGDVGKYTGYYYTASMAAQIVTPILSGFLVDITGWQIFFPYGAFFVAMSFMTMLFVKHGDSKPEQKKSVLENFDVDD